MPIKKNVLRSLFRGVSQNKSVFRLRKSYDGQVAKGGVYPEHVEGSDATPFVPASEMQGIQAKRGFSLIEIIITLALFCLTIGLLLANISFLNSYLLRSQVDKLYNSFIYLQRSAIATGQNKTLYFNPENNGYEFTDQLGKKTFSLPKQITFGYLPETKGPPSCPKKLLKSPITFKGNKVIFHKDGIIDSGTIYLVDKDKKYMYALSCSVSQASYVRKYVYTDKWVLIR